MTTLHLCIATGQNAANFIPLKQLGAEEVWILETPDMKKQQSARALSMALKSVGSAIGVRVLPFDDSTPKAMQDAAFRLAAEELDGRDVVFHVTGGTKLMVLAIHQQLANLESGSGSYRLLYADTQHKNLDWLGQEPRSQRMNDVLTLNELLLLRGYRSTNDMRPAKDQQRAAKRADVSRFMGDHAAALKGFFGALNFHGRKAADGENLMRQFDYLPAGKGATLLKKAQAHGLITVNEAINCVTFASKEVAGYFAGGWVEEYVFLKLVGISTPGMYAMNVQVEQAQSKSENEIDAILVKHNRSLVIECKAKKQDDAQAAIYKLGQVVKQVGGLMSRSLYVSARAISDADRNRAREYGIDVLAADQLANINQYLREWSAGA